MSKQPFIFKGEMTLVNVLALQSSDINTINIVLQQKRTEFSQLLLRSPVIVDCQAILVDCATLNLKLLHDFIREAGFVPVGLRNFPEALENEAMAAGWAIVRPGGIVRNAPIQTQQAAELEAPNINQSRDTSRLLLIDKPVRSGQQIYAADGDIVILQQTSAGSELLAAGSVHVYGSLRGRVLAGIHGDTSARIFCQKLEAELVAIAGRYRLLDEVNTPLKGKPAMIYLNGEKLVIDPMF